MKNCPNCDVEFSENRDKAFLCDACGWLTEIDGQWHPCKEPPKQVEPDPPKAEPKPEPGPLLPELTPEPEPGPAPGRVKNFLGGLVTVTEVEDDDDEEND